MFNDFKLKFICVYDYTFWLHMVRDALICAAFIWFNAWLAVGLAVGVNIAWEWQDGLLNDGFNFMDLLAGLVGVTIMVLIWRLT